MSLEEGNPIENNCPERKKYAQIGASLNKAKWNQGVVVIGMVNQVDLKVHYKEKSKKQADCSESLDQLCS